MYYLPEIISTQTYFEPSSISNNNFESINIDNENPENSLINSQNDNLRRKPRPWTPIEDQKLILAVSMFGINKWILVANYVGGNRTKSQCSQRWFRGLDPRLNKYSWTVEEDRLLLQLVNQQGTKSWTKIATSFPDRCDVQCRYRYIQLKKVIEAKQENSLKIFKKKINEEINTSLKTIPSIWTFLNK